MIVEFKGEKFNIIIPEFDDRELLSENPPLTIDGDLSEEEQLKIIKGGNNGN